MYRQNISDDVIIVLRSLLVPADAVAAALVLRHLRCRNHGAKITRMCLGGRYWCYICNKQAMVVGHPVLLLADWARSFIELALLWQFM